MGNKLALLAFLLALLALLLHTLGRGGERGTGAAAAREPDLGPLLARVEALEEENRRSREALDDLRLVTPPAPEREERFSSDARLDELERRVAELERRPEVPTDGQGIREELSEAARVEFLRRNTPGEGMQRAIDRAQDPAAAEEERLAGLRALRGQRDPAGIDARLYVLDSMLELARTSSKGETRADVWRQLSHVTDARLRQPLLDALAYDEHAKSREEAAETLEDFLPDLGVEAALRAAAENDADAGVRRQAAASLVGGR